MKLTPAETRFLTALLREHNQNGCRGPAHDLLRKHAYPEAPADGAGSLAFAYEVVPLSGLLLRDFHDLQQIDDFVHREPRIPDPEWPWSSATEYQKRLAEARREHSEPGMHSAGAKRVG
jgi:hypothetical protein